MAKRRGRKNVKNAPGNAKEEEEPPVTKSEEYQQVELQSAAIRALRDVEIEQLRTMLRLLHLNFSEEQLRVPVLHFFKENIRNLSIVKNEEDNQYEVQWKDNDVKTSLFGADNMQIRAFNLEERSETQPFELPDALQTPGVINPRLSVGMTPKTLRLPKPGEMLLSVHGSPLGVYKEENMEAIQEAEDG